MSKKQDPQLFTDKREFTMTLTDRKRYEIAGGAMYAFGDSKHQVQKAVEVRELKADDMMQMMRDLLEEPKGKPVEDAMFVTDSEGGHIRYVGRMWRPFESIEPESDEVGEPV